MPQPPAITALVIPPDGHAYLTRVVPDLETMQALVGGHLEAVALTPDATLYLNSEGKYEGLSLNETAVKIATVAQVGLDPNDFIVGPVVIAGIIGPTGSPDGADHDVPASVFAVFEQAGVAVAALPDDIEGTPAQ